MCQTCTDRTIKGHNLQAQQGLGKGAFFWRFIR